MAVSSRGTLRVVSTNADNNTAVVKYEVECTTSGSSYNNYEQTGTFYIDGNRYSNTYTLPANKTTTVFKRQVTVSNASGRRISASYSFPSTPSYGTQSGSDSVTIPILLETPVIEKLTLKSRTLNSLTFSYELEENADSIYYKLSSNSSYTRIATNSKSGSFTVSDLDPNTSYTINFKVRNSSGSTNKDANKNVSGTTYEIGKISDLNDLVHGDAVNISITNPSGSDLRIDMNIENTTILTKTVNSGSNTIIFSDKQLDEMYKKYGNLNSLTATFVLTTDSKYTNTKSCIITLKGNQKNGHKKINQKWCRCKRFKKVNGNWIRVVRWIKKDGSWKRCI